MELVFLVTYWNKEHNRLHAECLHIGGYDTIIKAWETCTAEAVKTLNQLGDNWQIKSIENIYF